MSVSVEFITATIFAVIMVLIGLGAIWIVRWQTYFLLRHQGKSPDVRLLTTMALFLFMSVHSSLPGHDLERGSHAAGPIVTEGDSVELAATSPISDNSSRESGSALIDTQHTSTDRLSSLSDTTVVDKTW
jgi:Kef-type K+ transport system membrane component KefB